MRYNVGMESNLELRWMSPFHLRCQGIGYRCQHFCAGGGILDLAASRFFFVFM